MGRVRSDQAAPPSAVTDDRAYDRQLTGVVAAVADPTEKTCSKCGETKPLDEFPLQLSRRIARCKACVAIRQRAHYLANRDRILKQTAAYRAAHREEISAQKSAYGKANRQRILEQRKARYAQDPQLLEQQRQRVRDWIAAHPEVMAEHARKKRAKRKAAPIEPVDPSALWTGLCGICGEPLDSELKWPDPMSKSLDHIEPLSRGGGHVQSNLRWAHLICNTRRGARSD